jgi:hypothetical protein
LKAFAIENRVASKSFEERKYWIYNRQAWWSDDL